MVDKNTHLWSDRSSDADLRPPDHAELLGDGHVLLQDVVAGGADVGGEHHVTRHLRTVQGDQLELQHLSPLEEGVAEVAVDADFVHEITENILDIILATNEGEDSAEVEVDPGEVSWFTNITHCHVHQYLSILTKL